MNGTLLASGINIRACKQIFIRGVGNNYAQLTIQVQTACHQRAVHQVFIGGQRARRFAKTETPKDHTEIPAQGRYDLRISPGLAVMIF